MIQLKEGNILEGPFWPDRVRVVSAETVGENHTKFEAMGVESEEGLDRATLDSRDRETLRQIHAEIEEWSEE